MTSDMALFNEFLMKWPLDRVRKMSLGKDGEKDT